MRRLIVLVGLAMLPLAAPAETTRLNKCIDAHGAVTYSNLPCRNAREARTVEVDPAPPADATSTPRSEPKPVAAPPEPAEVKLETQRVTGKPKPSAHQCDALADKLGTVLDKMDQARRNGYTQAQMAKWNDEIRALERKKQQIGCF